MESKTVKISLDDSSNFWLSFMQGTDICEGDVDLGEGPVGEALREVIDAGVDLGEVDVDDLIKDAQGLLAGESTSRYDLV